jgi:hypothetical protein
VLWIGYLHSQDLFACLLRMQNHFNVEGLIVVLSIGCTLDPHILQVIVKYLVKFEPSIKLVLLILHSIRPLKLLYP